MLFIVISLWSAIVSVATTAILIRYYTCNAVLASALPSLIVALAVLFLQKTIPLVFVKEIPIVFLGSSFVGMSAAHHLRVGWHIVFGAFIFWILYNAGRVVAVGFGGRLGLIACISVLCTIGLDRFFTVLDEQIRRLRK